MFTAPIDGRVYARRGTTFDTRLTVLDRGGEQQGQVYAGARVHDAAHLLQVVAATAPARLPIQPVPGADLFGHAPAPRPAPPKRPRTAARPAEPTPHDWGPVGALTYEAIPAASDAGEHDHQAPTQASGPYAPWRASAIHVPGAVAHPTPLVQSGAMAAVPHPMPSYRPMLPERVVSEGRLSDAQLESVVLAGQAHERHLAALYRIGSGWETVQRVDCEGDDEDGNDVQGEDEVLSEPVRFRRGWMLGDGTGCGKGRQVAAIVLDQRLRGRKRALWLSQSDKLLEDARRDWCAIGGRAEDVIPLGKIRQGADIPHTEGILFTTYATLRSPARQGKRSRLDQIVAWLAGGEDHDQRHAYQGCIVFDEAHAMANAAGSKGSRGEVRPSQQGRAGLRLQNALPDARILYVSATGATTVPGLAYARRLGLWASGETPFETRTGFVAAMEAGGVAAMEVVARDLKALGLYQARALSYDGVEVDILEHPLTPEQRRIYDAYAGAFKIIHANIQDALKATGIVDGESTLNKNAKSAALSAFEGAKQRFFGHLLTSMKCPSLIRAIEADMEEGRSAVVQLVSTGEALMERRIAEIPASEWDDLSIDLTPREYVLDFLAHAFPVQLQEPFTDDDGNVMSRPVFDADRNPVLCQEAVAKRDALIQKLGSLPPVQSALDQIVHRFGHDAVAEITGRSRRVLKIADARGERLALRSRPASANLAETAAFMDRAKRILVFSMAGGIGRSYHADLGCPNTERRIHYLLEPGWRADQAIQGLGRTHRTHQASAPLFRPVATDVKGERRFIATIARRLDSLGAITRGQRDSQTTMGGDDTALFRASDNLESPYAKSALRQFYIALWRGHIQGWSLADFEQATGLKLTYEGNLKEDLPPMPQFLNRLLALPSTSRTRSSPPWRPGSRPTSRLRSRPAPSSGASRPSPPTRLSPPRARRCTRTKAPAPRPRSSRSCARTGWSRSPPMRRSLFMPRFRAASPGSWSTRSPSVRGSSCRRRRACSTTAGCRSACAWSAPPPARPWRVRRWTPPSGGIRTRIAGAPSGTPRSRRCPPTANPASGWSPGCCCRSGTGCPARACGSAASSRMTASTSSAASSAPPRSRSSGAPAGLPEGPASPPPRFTTRSWCAARPSISPTAGASRAGA